MVAENYLDMLAMRKEALYQQLTSDAGDGYIDEEVSYTVAKVYR